MSNRNLLCFDISSGGVSASLFDNKLEIIRAAEAPWEPGASFSVQNVLSRFKHSIRALNVTNSDPIDAICIGTFMHNCVLLDASGEPNTPVFTWLDQRGWDKGVEYVRSRLGDRFHELTGCRYHPMFPVFKLAMLRLSAGEGLFQATREIVSIKAFLINRLTGTTAEDCGMASASGLFNVKDGGWDAEILSLLGIERSQLPPLVNRNEIVGSVTSRAASEFGLGKGTLVVAGSGDGFLANVGSGCEDSTKIAVTLGTSAVARQTLLRPVLNSSSGTFCYNDGITYLLGCAGSNGGNVLDWGRHIFGSTDDSEVSEDLPIFVPLLHGERSPEWDPLLRASWHGLTAQHTAADLSRSILEGVIFNLVHFMEIVKTTSGEAAARLVLSGNGFLDPLAAPMLAAVAAIPTDLPRAPGLMSLRGAAICALRALALPVPPLHPEEVSPLKQQRLLERYHTYRRLRASAAASMRS